MKMWSSGQKRGRGSGGLTLLEALIAIIVLTVLVIGSGGVLASLARQNDMNRQMALVDSEVGNVLSLIHTAPFDSITTDLLFDGFVDLGNYTFRKDLSTPPLLLTNGRLDVVLQGVAGPPLPDPLMMEVTATWDSQPAGEIVKRFITVRTR